MQKHFSFSVRRALEKLSAYTDNLYSDEAEKVLQDIANGIKVTNRPLNRLRYDKLVNCIPDGIYTTINQLLRIIRETKKRSIELSTTVAPLIISYSEFDACKQIPYNNSRIITGRDLEIEQILLTLCKQSKRGVILVGEPGVGKTSIVHAINARLIERTVPAPLVGATILNMDLPYIFTKHKDDPLGVIIKIFEKASVYDKVILFIDEVHQLFGHKMNDIMKPYLTEQIRFIGSTTVNEYHSIITEDAALERRFTVINVEEPDIKKTSMMIKGTKAVFEKQHKCIIPDEICDYLVTNGERFLGHRRNPDKSLDLLDLACSIMNSKEIQKKFGNIELSGDFIADLEKNKKEIEGIVIEAGNRRLNEYYVNMAISAMTNIPYNDIKNSLNFDIVLKNLRSKVFGQDEQLVSVANIVNIFKHSRNRNRPIAILIFAGPSGVGKRLTAMELARNIFGSKDRFIEYNMSGMTSEFMITELKGAPPGYVGYGKSGGLIKNIRNNPQSVILFKGTNKAHEAIQQYLIDCTRNGKITDSAEREASLINTVIIHSITLTNDECKTVFNQCSKTMGFRRSENENGDREPNINALKKIIGEELYRSADEVIVFNQLSDDILRKIFEYNINDYVGMYDVDIDRATLESVVLTDSKNGHDVMTKLMSEVPKLVFNKLKELGYGKKKQEQDSKSNI